MDTICLAAGKFSQLDCIEPLPSLQYGSRLALILTLLRAKSALYALSNTNNAHAAHFLEAYAELFAAFDTLFLSHRIGGRKPEPAAFEHVAQAIGLTPAEIVLFDDLDANIAAARALGFQTVHVTGPAATEAPAARL